jgi:hypothetical protein
MDNPEKMATQGTQDEDKQNKKHNTICVGHHYTQIHTNNVNKTRALLQTTGGKDEPKKGLKIPNG